MFSPVPESDVLFVNIFWQKWDEIYNLHLFIYLCIFVVGGGGQMTQQKLVCTGFSQRFIDSSNISGLLENGFLKWHQNHRASSERMSD